MSAVTFLLCFCQFLMVLLQLLKKFPNVKSTAGFFNNILLCSADSLVICSKQDHQLTACTAKHHLMESDRKYSASGLSEFRGKTHKDCKLYSTSYPLQGHKATRTLYYTVVTFVLQSPCSLAFVWLDHLPHTHCQSATADGISQYAL